MKEKTEWLWLRLKKKGTAVNYIWFMIATF